LTTFYHATVNPSTGTPIAFNCLAGCDDAAEKDMKIYLLIMLIGTLLAAVRFTPAREQRSKSLQQ